MPSKTAATYTVQPGDELRHIAADNHVSIWKIIEANDIPDPDSLRIGQVLNIPSD
jgi:LysM repeat protein